MQEFTRTVQEVETVGRIVEGTALTFDRAYRVSDDAGRTFYLEGWKTGAFTEGLHAMRNTFELRVDHHDERAGTVTFTEGRRTLDFTATTDETPIGDAVLALIDAGRLGSVSLRFSSDRQKERDGVVWRLRGRPRELSVAMGHRAQYDDALVTGRRALEADPAELAAAAAAAERTTSLLARSRVMLDIAARL
jgi:phage head maturation protease